LVTQASALKPGVEISHGAIRISPMITTRLLLASRIQLLLFRELGEKIVIDRLLTNDLYARDVLLACEATRKDELVTLAQRFRHAAPRPGHEPQAAEWADVMPGFGMTPPPAKDVGWLAATRRWLGL
jgi:hypothetical protein